MPKVVRQRLVALAGRWYSLVSYRSLLLYGRKYGLSRLTRITIILALTASALSCSAQVRRALDGLAATQGEKVEQNFTSPEGGFTVGLPPTKPKCEPFDSERGRRESCAFTWFIVNMGRFELRYMDGGSDVGGVEGGRPVLQRLRDMLVEKNGGMKVLRDADLTVDGYAGREIVLEGDKGLFIQRFYVAGRRPFDFNVFLPSDYGYKQEDVRRVLDTFHLTSENRTKEQR